MPLKQIFIIVIFHISFPLLGQDILDSIAIKSFSDSFFIEKQDRIAALGICIVKDTSILYQAAFGTTDFTEPDKSQATPAETVFGAASVSKLFVATALMQLVEQGKVNLNDDIRTYLPWLQIKFTDNQKITILQLLTHTGGIEDGMIGVNYNDPEFPKSMETFFKEYKPKVVFTPGKEMSYSNRGMSLIGLTVEKVSGIPFYEYVGKNIFAPLQMQHSSFMQPLPDTLKQKSLKYLPELDNDFLIIYPSGSLFTTVADMGNFMISHLNDGKFHNSKILNPSSIHLMHSPQFTPQEGIPFMSMAFMELNFRGHKILYHTGARYYNTILVLIPELKIGIYISLNGDGSIRKEFLKEFLTRFLPDKEVKKPPITLNTEAYKGIYRFNLGSRTTIEMLPLMAMQAKVSVIQNHLKLSVIGFRPVTLTAVDSNTFMGDDGGYYVFELKNFKGYRLFRSNVQWDDPMTFTRISFYENGKFHGILMLLSTLFLTLIFITWSIKILSGKFYFKNDNKLLRLSSILSYTSVSFFILPFLIVIGFIIKGDYASHIKSNLYFLFALFNVSVTLGIISIPFHFHIQRIKTGTKSIRRQFIITSFVFVILLCIGWYWNLIGFHFK